MTPALTPAGLAATHAAAFGAAKGWPAQDFDGYLADPSTLIFGDDTCFAVIRLAGPEAEILTLATHPDVQGQGRARTMLRDALTRLRAVKVEEVFLEVSEDNIAAKSLYLACGFTAFSTRPNYYANGASAICMKAALSAASPA